MLLMGPLMLKHLIVAGIGIAKEHGHFLMVQSVILRFVFPDVPCFRLSTSIPGRMLSIFNPCYLLSCSLFLGLFTC
jgi:hypothetical protein